MLSYDYKKITNQSYASKCIKLLTPISFLTWMDSCLIGNLTTVTSPSFHKYNIFIVNKM